MSDDEIMELRGKNADRFKQEKETLYQEYIKMDNYLLDEFNKNKKHFHFKRKKEMSQYMSRDFNPFNTFSYGKTNPMIPPKDEK